MRTTQLFGQTLREAPVEADVTSHRLLVRAGFIRQLGAGIFTYLHLAKRSITKIENLIREEMDAIGGQEISMPVVHPADIWKETGRWHQIGSEMGRFRDKNEHDMVLAMTHEEVVGDLVRREIQSYKQLPRLIYHIQTKWRDDPRPRAGLIRVREFTMKDSYSLDSDGGGLNHQYCAHYQAYFNIYNRCSLPVTAIRSDTGMMGGSMAHEFMYLTDIGEDTLLICDQCGYKANRQVARFNKEPLPVEEAKEIVKVSTPGTHSIDSLVKYLNIPREKTAKAVFLVAQFQDNSGINEKFIFAVVRGDMELNETKLLNAIKAKELRPARDDEILAIGAVPGFASPVGLKNVLIIVDDIIPVSPNLVSGANETDYHFLNVNYQRDFSSSQVVDIASANEGCGCPDCGSPLTASRGVEVGNIFKLGTHYSELLNCNFLASDGSLKPVYMGSYGIGIGRLLACIVEEHHDQNGIIWPVSVAPYQIHMVLLRGKGDEKSEIIAEQLYKILIKAGLEVLYDDSLDSPGIKFNNADLIGCPIRITVSDRAATQGGIEIKLRGQEDKSIIPMDNIVQYLTTKLNTLLVEISNKATVVPYAN
ncbi:MAG: proline--tRNA ligase [Chloroflexi bacterium GWB2_49_20]|nr:MAG: proline--tRNA ligase [Chloroflexi bacterium GWB2_49_20]OGN79973.1 MAG: proline--tRNA ligase [Chloroflexi bacterium GWC2_49_37]OGN85491.1 MAG: proline--tRNA ligase [Chloroflexi bacterium GWD2_49_16]HBG74360.1 proline--tRNA ligase [Anaerolineae bacterium]HCM97030.1 proline--tRNA ligase [Anaerolineae bacterium]